MTRMPAPGPLALGLPRCGSAWAHLPRAESPSALARAPSGRHSPVLPDSERSFRLRRAGTVQCTELLPDSGRIDGCQWSFCHAGNHCQALDAV